MGRARAGEGIGGDGEENGLSFLPPPEAEMEVGRGGSAMLEGWKGWKERREGMN